MVPDVKKCRLDPRSRFGKLIQLPARTLAFRQKGSVVGIEPEQDKPRILVDPIVFLSPRSDVDETFHARFLEHQSSTIGGKASIHRQHNLAAYPHRQHAGHKPETARPHYGDHASRADLLRQKRP